MVVNGAQIRDVIARRSPFTKGLCAFVVVLNLLGQIEFYENFALEPGA
jgi:hypothetical protein